MEVSDFLKRFHFHTDIDEVFTNGCCYWFANILYHRFLNTGATIMYDEVINHFGTMIGNKIYDITGDVTDKYNWVSWDSIHDTALKSRIIRDCIMF